MGLENMKFFCLLKLLQVYVCTFKIDRMINVGIPLSLTNMARKKKETDWQS